MIAGLGYSIQGLQQSSYNVAKAADRVADPNRESDLATDLVDVKVNANNFEANALVVQTTSELQDSLFEAVGNNLDIEV
jgi:hypothetical protein